MNQKKIQQFIKENDGTFITVGRFSYEKGHQRLMDAFKTVQDNNKDKKMGLIIVGGYGRDYEKELEYAKNIPNLICIKNMSNPQPLIRMCDCFVLSSYYEGQGLVLLEADIQGLPVISTNVNGPHSFMKGGKGLLVENNKEGLIHGMQKFIDGESHYLGINYKV